MKKLSCLFLMLLLMFGLILTLSSCHLLPCWEEEEKPEETPDTPPEDVEPSEGLQYKLSADGSLDGTLVAVLLCGERDNIQGCKKPKIHN